jgi:hypothetical protein
MVAALELDRDPAPIRPSRGGPVGTGVTVAIRSAAVFLVRNDSGLCHSPAVDQHGIPCSAAYPILDGVALRDRAID